MALGLSLTVAGADASLANSARDAARTIARESRSTLDHALWFEGHWGFQYYMMQAGAKPLDFDRPVLATGDELVLPDNNANVIPLDPKWIQASSERVFPVTPWLATLNPTARAGFYSSVFGPLPFAFGPAPAERYRVVTIGSR